jgi:hypothetical protein
MAVERRLAPPTVTAPGDLLRSVAVQAAVLGGDMAELGVVRDIKRRLQDDLLGRPGVTGVDVGHKIVAGRKTDEVAVRVFVERKRNVRADQRVPPEVDGVRTDVIQLRFKPNVERMRMLDVELMVDAARYGDLRGGMSIGPCRSLHLLPPEVPAEGDYVFVGTLGALVTDTGTGERMMLTNFHVAALDDGWNAGDTVAQPSLVDGGRCPADVVGTLQRAVIAGSTGAGGPGVDGAVWPSARGDHGARSLTSAG